MDGPRLAEVTPLTNARNAREKLQEIIDEYGDTLDYLVVIAVHKDRTRSIFTSMASHEEKSFLKCFWDAWVLRWFDNDQTV